MPRKPFKQPVNDHEARPPRREDLKYARLKGMRDILFDDYRYYNLVMRKAAELAAVYGFKRIDTPVLERQELYERATGRETDIVSKEMYAFTDKSGERVALRPEATPGLVRAYIEHGMFNLPQPVKMFWMGPAFRHDKPQAGRYRQFNQFDLEIFGDPSPMADTQLILAAYNFFSELQLPVSVQVNSIGDPEDRQEYLKKLVDYYKERGKRAKLCNDCKRRLAKNPLRLLDCKEDPCQELKQEAPQVVDFLGDASRDHFIRVLEYLDELEVPYNLNPFLVRGLDYYNRTVFEIVPAAEEGEGAEPSARRQSSLCGGGRYDRLVAEMGGRPTPACGFGLGLERVVAKVREKGIPIQEDRENVVFLAQLGEQARRKMMAMFEEMRKAGFRVREAFTKDSLKGQLEEADRAGAKYTLILGQKELMDGTLIIRDMESGTQEVIDQKKVVAEVTKRLNAASTAASISQTVTV